MRTRAPLLGLAKYIYIIITRPSFQEEAGIVLGLVVPSSSNRPLLFTAHALSFSTNPWVVTWRDRREGPSSILRLGPSYTIAEFNRRVNLRFCIDHRIAMAKKWRVKESEWILAGVFKKMRCDLFCFLFFSSKIYLTLTYSYFEKYYWFPPLILNGKRRKTTWGDKLFFFTNIKTDRFHNHNRLLNTKQTNRIIMMIITTMLIE